MNRPKVRLAAVSAVVAGILLSTGAGVAAAVPGSDNGNGGGNHAGNSANEHSTGKPAPASAGGGSKSNGNGSDSEGSGKASNGNSSGKSSNASSNGSEHSASKTKTDTTAPKSNGNSAKADKPETEGNGNSANGNGNSGNGKSNGNNSSDDSSDSPSTQTPSTPAAEQPAAQNNSGSEPTGQAPAPIRNKDNAVTSLTPGARPSATAAPESTPSVPTTAGDARRGAADAAALSTQMVSDPNEGSGGATMTSAREWIAKAGNQFISSVAKAIREVTLKDLALAALPGIAGLLFAFSTGIGLGHRQAKYGFVMETTGALRFAVRGPVGVVRPGGSVAVRASKGAKRPTHLTLVDRAA